MFALLHSLQYIPSNTLPLACASGLYIEPGIQEIARNDQKKKCGNFSKFSQNSLVYIV